MYYATYAQVGYSDIAAFETKEERDRWVIFQDDFSRWTGTTADTCVFYRMALSTEEAESRTPNMIHRIDTYNPRQHWYIIKADQGSRAKR